MERSIFTLTLIQDGETISIHATHTGPRSTAFEAGLALVDSLAGTDGIGETAELCAHTTAPAWVQ